MFLNALFLSALFLSALFLIQGSGEAAWARLCMRPRRMGAARSSVEESAGRPLAVAGVHRVVQRRHPQGFAVADASTGNTVHFSLEVAKEAVSLAEGARTVVAGRRAVNAFG